MIATKRYIRNLREKSILKTSAEMEKTILEKLGHEPEPDDEGHQNIYSEDDLWHHINKLLQNKKLD